MQEVRDDALHMLGVLGRTWKEGAVEGAAPVAAAKGVVIGNLQDSCQQFQYQLSAKLARWGRPSPEPSARQKDHILQGSLSHLGWSGRAAPVQHCWAAEQGL